jgi:acetyl-CoA/propionyl-CoA carboxylase biotin carboxyl carrier protein
MEMNTRLQVEHPVTELVYGLDLVEWQLRVAAGESLPFDAGSVPAMNGHAVEARVYAEDPARGFLPTGGTVLALREPVGPDVRVDSGLATGVPVGSTYDPMLAKVIAWGEDRATALRRLDAALADTAVLGVTTNVAFLRTLLADPAVRAGRLDTSLAEQVAARAAGPAAVPDEVIAAAALAQMLATESAAPPGSDPWDIPDGWRMGEQAWTKLRFAAGPAGAAATEVRVRGLASAGGEVAVGDGAAVPAAARHRGADLLVSYGNRTVGYVFAVDGATLWLGRDGHAWALTEEPPAPIREGRGRSADATVRSPMPGTVLVVHVTEGDQVAVGQPLLIVEAMKMENVVTAPVDGVVTELTARAGQQVSLDETLAVIKEHA